VSGRSSRLRPDSHDPWARITKLWNRIRKSQPLALGVALATLVGFLAQTLGLAGVDILLAVVCAFLAGVFFPRRSQTHWRHISGWLCVLFVLSSMTVVGRAYLAGRSQGDAGPADASFPPLTATMSWENARARLEWSDGGTIWAVPGTITEAQLPTINGFKAWARQHGGGPDGDSMVRVIIQGKSPQDVVLTDMRIQVVKRLPIRQGTTFDLCSKCGVIPKYSFHADLDNLEPILEPNNGKLGGRRETDFPHVVSSTKTETIDLLVTTSSCDCLWNLYLDWESLGHKGSVLINQGVGPLRTTYYSGQSSDFYDYCDDNDHFRRCA
jgi:hypothetical protein